MREFRQSDVEQVALLWQRCFRKTTTPPSAAVQRYFADVLLKHPWYDPELASLVLERHGEVVGFIGRMARPMIFHGETLRAAVATQLMVDPNRKLGYAAFELVRYVQAGPQDVLYSDGANDHSLRIWTRCGGQASRLLSFEWTRALRPMQSRFCSLREHPSVGAIARAGHSLSGAIDALAVRMLPRWYRKPRAQLCRRLVTAREILPLLQRVSQSAALRPAYSSATLDWLLRKAAEAQQLGELRTVMVCDRGETPIGWFIYFAKAGEVAQVLQAGALPRCGIAVLSELFRDAWEQDAASVSGQLDPLLLTELSNSYCQFRCSSLGVLVRARRPEVLNAIQSGDAFLSRLEGEWWMRLGIDRNGRW